MDAQGGQEDKGKGEKRVGGREEGLVSFKQRGVAYKTVNESTAGWSSPRLRLNNVEARERAWRDLWRREEEPSLFPLSVVLSLTFFLPFSSSIYLSPFLFLFLAFFSSFYHSDGGGKEEDR